MLSQRKKSNVTNANNGVVTPIYASRELTKPIPKYEIPEFQTPAATVAQLISDELNLDGNPALNLASFVTTWMEPEARELMTMTVSKNFVDVDEYPQSAQIHDRCVNIVANLFHAPDSEDGVGCATVGSSEAIHLAGLALKWRWKSKMSKAGKPVDKPNIVMGHNVQVCWEKFARYFDVEPRYVELTDTRFILGVEEAIALVDENTIAVVGILGSTYTGEYEPIKELNDALDALQERTGLDVPIHVDAASGGFVAPFIQPNFVWDFRLDRVVSINTSGHKYGLVYPGIGWVVWRDRQHLPEDLIFHVNYLGGDHPTFNLNFSRSTGQIISQYYNFLRLGRSGYTEIMRALKDIANFISDQITEIGEFELISQRDALPVVCFRTNPGVAYSVFDLSAALKGRGWIVPAYTLAPNAENISVLRIVVREGLSEDMATMLIEDIKRAISQLKQLPEHSRPTSPRHSKKTHGVC